MKVLFDLKLCIHIGSARIKNQSNIQKPRKKPYNVRFSLKMRADRMTHVIVYILYADSDVADIFSQINDTKKAYQIEIDWI